MENPGQGIYPAKCPRCSRDLPKLEGVNTCPYCGMKIAPRKCLGCGRDLSLFPADIKKCPYCGRIADRYP